MVVLGRAGECGSACAGVAAPGALRSTAASGAWYVLWFPASALEKTALAARGPDGHPASELATGSGLAALFEQRSSRVQY